MDIWQRPIKRSKFWIEITALLWPDIILPSAHLVNLGIGFKTWKGSDNYYITNSFILKNKIWMKVMERSKIHGQSILHFYANFPERNRKYCRVLWVPKVMVSIYVYLFTRKETSDSQLFLLTNSKRAHHYPPRFLFIQINFTIRFLSSKFHVTITWGIPWLEKAIRNLSAA